MAEQENGEIIVTLGPSPYQELDVLDIDSSKIKNVERCDSEALEAEGMNGSVIQEDDANEIQNEAKTDPVEPMDVDLIQPIVNTPEVSNGVSEEHARGEKRKYDDEEIFIQPNSCAKASKYLTRCRDCWNRKENAPELYEDVCRFQSFRKLQCRRNTKGGFSIITPGFCDPFKDPTEEDVNLWLPNKGKPPEGLELDVCKDLITQLGDQICSLILQEKVALEIERTFGDNRPTYWKRIVDEVREMCDVCATTLFNYHWICESCGFVACLACFKARTDGILPAMKKEVVIPGLPVVEKDEYNWLPCKSSGHVPVKMRLTQIIPGTALQQIGQVLHKVRREWNIAQRCGCPDAQENGHGPAVPLKTENSTVTQASSENRETGITSSIIGFTAKESTKVAGEDSENDDDDDESFFGISLGGPEISVEVETDTELSATNQLPVAVDICQPTPTESNLEVVLPSEQKSESHTELKHFVRTQNNSYYEKAHFPQKISYFSETEALYPNLPHQWLCSGTLLRLLDPEHPDNYAMFKDLWKRGQPVLVSKVGNRLTDALWSPESFMLEYGHQRSDLVNCMSGKLLRNMKIETFWKGFLDVADRWRDANNVPMLLKLKDWPPAEDFAKFSPKRFEDLMKALPLKDYTHRTGRLNLAARLPNNFIQPDLGPKMYIAYGDGCNLDKGTTNLHLDISDAVNCMVYVGVPKNCGDAHNKAVLKAIEDSDCDAKSIRRVTKDGELAGALWHLYRPWDADKIRDLINKISVENGQAIEPNHDPIHDQVVYLDKDLRKRLREEYNVVGFPIVQCAGDAVFIPAGAPHQVRNLHNCIKIAEDFVSPENVSHCFQLTEEFRSLSETHSNHEDKLQIKNIVFHACKDALSVLMHAKE